MRKGKNVVARAEAMTDAVRILQVKHSLEYGEAYLEDLPTIVGTAQTVVENLNNLPAEKYLEYMDAAESVQIAYQKLAQIFGD